MGCIGVILGVLVIGFFFAGAASGETWGIFGTLGFVLCIIVKVHDAATNNNKEKKQEPPKKTAPIPTQKSALYIAEKQQKAEQQFLRDNMPIDILLQQKNRKSPNIRMLLTQSMDNQFVLESEPFGNPSDAVSFAKWFRKTTNINATIKTDPEKDHAYIVYTKPCYDYHLPWSQYRIKNDVWYFPNPIQGFHNVFDDLIELDQFDSSTHDEAVALCAARKISWNGNVRKIMISPQGADLPPMIYVINKNNASIIIYPVLEEDQLRSHHVNIVLEARETYQCDAAVIITNTTMSPTANLIAESNKVEMLTEIKDLEQQDIEAWNGIGGIQYETHVADKLKSKGFTSVSLTPKSGDFGADIIAYEGNRKFCFQCKYYSGSVGISAIQEVLGAKSYYNCDVAVVVTNSKLTASAKELAKKSGVIIMENFT